MATNVINPAAHQLVVQNYFNLVQAIANKIKRRLPAHVDVQDLVQTGMIGLLEASRRYDASRLVDFSSYANSRITGAILDELRKWDPCSRQDRKASREIEGAKQSLRATSGVEPTREEIAESVGTMIMIIITTYIAVPQLVNNEIFNLKTSGRHLTTIYTTDYIYLQ